MDKLLTQAEVAEFLRLTHPTLLDLIRSGKIKSVTVGKRRRFRKADVEAYLDGETKGETNDSKD